MGCNHACPYNTLAGCKVKVYNGICPLSNMASVSEVKPMTNADRIRAIIGDEIFVPWEVRYVQVPYKEE